VPHWFEALADHMGPAYLRYSFTKGTAQEVAFLLDVLGLRAGDRVLDVGCGPGRHSHELARHGVAVLGVDVSQRFVQLASASSPAGARFVRADARRLPLRPGSFDAAISLCQGGFGLLDGEADDGTVLAGIAGALRPGGALALTAFSAYFQVRYLEESRFDADRGINHERTEVRDEHGRALPVELHTTCYTPRELRLLCERAGLRVDAIWSVEPGRYARTPPTIDLPEFLVVARAVRGPVTGE
jgi:SAM-dependent methyltransferase